MTSPQKLLVTVFAILVTSVIGCSSGETKPEDGNSASDSQNPTHEERVESAVRDFHKGLLSDDEAIRVKAIDAILFNEKDFVALFGVEDGKSMWDFYKLTAVAMKKESEQMKGELTAAGELQTVTVRNLREGDVSDAYQKLFAAIPADIQVQMANLKYKNKTREMGPYLIVNDRVVFAQRLDRMYSHVMNEKPKQ